MANWSLTGSLAVARSGDSATLLPTGKILVGGGDSDKSRYTGSPHQTDKIVR